jgi:EAL domain-containing protein (putative c-di-GMP-specific phosphodiesterase class I)
VLLKTIVALGSALKLTMVAGIKTPEQHQIVRGLGCHRAQGFYFGRPAPVAEAGLSVEPLRAA